MFRRCRGNSLNRVIKENRRLVFLMTRYRKDIKWGINSIFIYIKKIFQFPLFPQTRENFIFYLDRLTPSQIMLQGLGLVGHVFSHAWVGSIVTASRWEFAWLNEAFGRYFEYKALHLVNKLMVSPPLEFSFSVRHLFFEFVWFLPDC